MTFTLVFLLIAGMAYVPFLVRWYRHQARLEGTPRPPVRPILDVSRHSEECSRLIAHPLTVEQAQRKIAPGMGGMSSRLRDVA
ncbi:hypothetical protein [Thermocrispum agreste]|uniref:hypothetical protein n=1 Tax=Thermocrispum agreste TaxID=37925 RepID=UPI000490DA28|nr:hypothetical protein [Thermocrispum agreste]